MYKTVVYVRVMYVCVTFWKVPMTPSKGEKEAIWPNLEKCSTTCSIDSWLVKSVKKKYKLYKNMQLCNKNAITKNVSDIISPFCFFLNIFVLKPKMRRSSASKREPSSCWQKKHITLHYILTFTYFLHHFYLLFIDF